MFGRRSDEERLQIRRLIDRAERVLDLIERALLAGGGGVSRGGASLGDVLGAVSQAFKPSPVPSRQVEDS